MHMLEEQEIQTKCGPTHQSIASDGILHRAPLILPNKKYCSTKYYFPGPVICQRYSWSLFILCGWNTCENVMSTGTQLLKNEAYCYIVKKHLTGTIKTFRGNCDLWKLKL